MSNEYTESVSPTLVGNDGYKPGFGDKIKGFKKELTGHIKRDPALVEAGRSDRTPTPSERDLASKEIAARLSKQVAEGKISPEDQRKINQMRFEKAKAISVGQGFASSNF